jgi:hypothetical protein
MAAVTRRDLLVAIGAGWLLDVEIPEERPIAGKLLGASHRVGHLLRAGAAPPIDAPSERCDVVIVGSGASGASAAWRLAAAGIEVRMVELEPFAGGTSTWSDEGVVPHPWGAHYLPAPDPRARATLRLLEEMGVVTGWDAAHRPLFREDALCHAPDERIFSQGRWHPGLVPWGAISPDEKRDYERFGELREQYRALVGSDGRPAFTSPVSFCSRDPAIVALDSMTMAQWLEQHDLRTPFVRWYVEYATLDDFGADLDDVSAWAGLFYFCSRKLETEQLGGSHYLVWPEGNGRLLRHLLSRMHGSRDHDCLVTAVIPHERGVTVEISDVSGQRPIRRRLDARAVVLAIPGFVAKRVLPPGPAARAIARASSPWVVANLHVERPVDPDRPWDSVIYQSPCLGYVDAGHQRMVPAARTVLTYFRAYGSRDASATRARLVDARWQELAAQALLDLSPADGTLALDTKRIDVMVWGHAMPRPRTGFLTAAGREPMFAPVMLDERIAWAHVDQTGFALFEEANAHGVAAAEAVCDALGVARGASWL